MKINFLLLALTIFFCSNLHFSQTAQPETDFQIWNETQLIFPIVKEKDSQGKQTEKVLFFITGNLRFGRKLPRLVDERIGFGFDFKVNKYVTLTPSYLYRAGQPFQGSKEYENRLRFAVNLEKKWKTFSLRDRNLLEYRLRHSRADSVRYRNKFQFNYPVIKDKKEMFTPFAANEVFYDFREKTFTRDEVSLGLSKKLNKNQTIDFYYLLQANKSGALKYLNVFGVNLKIKVD